MMRITTGLLAATLVAIGCGGAKSTNDGWRSAGAPRRATTEIEIAEDDGCDIATIYFGYDSADLDARSERELERIVTCVGNGRGLPVHLVGAADPRGTEEYNLALGERRSQTVRRYLVALGHDPNLVTYATVGEELSRGTNEATWALDRHVMPYVRETSRGLERPVASFTNDLDRPLIDDVRRSRAAQRSARAAAAAH